MPGELQKEKGKTNKGANLHICPFVANSNYKRFSLLSVLPTGYIEWYNRR